MKIVVLADDLTGAAEVGGIGYRFDLSTAVFLGSGPASSHEMVVIDTNSRCDSADRAKSTVCDIATQLTAADTRQIYKKVDSVLRGQVLAEIDGLLDTLQKQRAFLVAANPSRQRIIRDGIYYSNGIPIDQTSIAQDPTSPIRSSHVLQMLGTTSSPVYLRRVGEPLPSKGIIVCEVTSVEDLLSWTECLDEKTLASGGADFFEAILSRTHTPSGATTNHPTASRHTLVISGSALRDSPTQFEFFNTYQIPVIFIPKDLLLDVHDSTVRRDIRYWTDCTRKALEQSGNVVIAIGQPLSPDPSAPARLCHHMAELVTEIVHDDLVDHILVEGGSTASEIVRRLSWTRLTVVKEWAPGVVSLRPEPLDEKQSITLTLKPGSYTWPVELLRTLDKAYT